MTIAIDEATQVITVEQSDLSLVSGTLYELDTNDYRLAIGALLDDERYIWMDPAFNHNGEVTVAGVTLARVIEQTNGYSTTFENLTYSVRFSGSNNNLFDVDNGIMNPSGNVTIIPQNSAGLQTVSSGSGLDAGQDTKLSRIHELLDVIEGTLDHQEVMRILFAAAAGKVAGANSTNVTIRDQADTKDRIDATVDEYGNRTAVTVDAS